MACFLLLFDDPRAISSREASAELGLAIFIAVVRAT